MKVKFGKLMNRNLGTFYPENRDSFFLKTNPEKNPEKEITILEILNVGGAELAFWAIEEGVQRDMNYDYKQCAPLYVFILEKALTKFPELSQEKDLILVCIELIKRNITDEVHFSQLRNTFSTIEMFIFEKHKNGCVDLESNRLRRLLQAAAKMMIGSNIMFPSIMISRSIVSDCDDWKFLGDVLKEYLELKNEQ